MKNQIKIIHTADFHYSRENQEKALASLETVCDEAEKKEVDLIVIAGDLFDRPVNNTESSGFPALIKTIQWMMNTAPVVAITGTPTHDISGCYDVFREIDSLHNFQLLPPGRAHFLNHGIVTNEVIDPDLLIFGIPEVSKQFFLKDKQLGKAEADEAIKKGMRELLLGMGAIRKQYPNIPCLLTYHGMVSGSTLCNNQILPAGGIQIGKDDLTLVGADYYALGHIHLAQQIGGIPAFYSGSAYPIDWGETDQKGFFYVTIEQIDGQFISAVDRIHYSHSPRKKIVVEWPFGKNFSTFDEKINGYDVWLQIKVKKEDRNGLNTESILTTLKNQGALPGSKVEVLVIPTETIRSEQITEVSKLKDKVKIYADLSSDSISDSIIEKADSLELTAKEEGLAAEGLHIRIKKLSLRGAIGIRKGIGRDQIDIDFDTHDPGLVALIGVNGSGKTTLIENMHPYTQMLTRTGKLQDHFMLRDSFRDLYFIDERTGTEYRSFMQIDGANKSGAVEYYLYENGNPVTNGRKENYEQKIHELFGSLSLFLRSAFVSQKQPKNLPDLSDATKGEKKALFRELGGLGYLQIYSEKANENGEDLAFELNSERLIIENLEEDVSVFSEKQDEWKNLDTSKVKTEAHLKEIEKRGFELKTRIDDLTKKVEKNRELNTTIKKLSEDIDGYNKNIIVLKDEIVGYEYALKEKDKIESNLKHLGNLKEKEAKLNEEKAKTLEERERLRTQYQHDKDAVGSAERSLLDKKATIEKESSGSNRTRDSLASEANRLDEELSEPVTENCPTCGQKWTIEKRIEFEKAMIKKKEKLEDLKKKIFEIDKDLIDQQKQLTKIDTEMKALEWPKTPELPSFDQIQLDLIVTEISETNESFLRSGLEDAKEAEVRIDEDKKRMNTIEKQIEKANEKKTELMHQIDEEAEKIYQEVTAEMEEVRRRYVETDKELVRIKTEIGAIFKELEELATKKDQLKDMKESVKEKERDLQEWQYLQRACGPDGIQALELDAMGPGIADIANSILESAYGSRFRIEFRTTRIGGSGSKTKQIEDFMIVIHDSQDGSEQFLETLSGGEGIWLKRAIYDAFGIIRARKTGTKFLTVFMDECDGALDPEARYKFFQMLQRAHSESKRFHTIVITHSDQAQEIIPQKIYMEDFK